MSRGGRNIKKREIHPDPVYKSVLLAKFINRLMKDGKKTVAQRVLYDALDIIRKQNDNALGVFESALDSIGPKMEVKARRIGGAAYQVPVEVRGERRTSLAIRWLLEAARKRPSGQYRTFAEKLAAEIIDANNNAGEAIRKRDIAHRMADANKAFAHFRW
jgi:small subunit ribosomal protein S7